MEYIDYITINLFNLCQQSFLTLYIYFLKCWHMLNEPVVRPSILYNKIGYRTTQKVRFNISSCVGVSWYSYTICLLLNIYNMLIIYLYQRQKHVEFHISGLFKRHSLIGFINFSLFVYILWYMCNENETMLIRRNFYRKCNFCRPINICRTITFVIMASELSYYNHKWTNYN